VGTGEGNPRNSINIGEGIYKTLDGGKTWKRMGLEKTRNIHRIIIDPTQPNTVYAGAIGNPYAEHPERGVFKSWIHPIPIKFLLPCGSIAVPPGA
jgi:hypothetical protein